MILKGIAKKDTKWLHKEECVSRARKKTCIHGSDTMIATSENPRLQATFRALADPTRRQIISLLGERERTVGQVSEQFDMTRAAVKKHLVVLEKGEIVTSETRGRERINRLNPAALKRAADWLSHFDNFWDERLEALGEAVDEEVKKRTKADD